MFLIRIRDRFLMGRGVRREWLARTFEEALTALEELRTFKGWRVGYLSYDFGRIWQGVESRHVDELNTPFLHFVAPEEVKWVEKLPRVNGIFCAKTPLSDLSVEEYADRIAQIHHYLREGETYEVNFAQRFRGEFEGDPAVLFARLYELNPSPHACFLDLSPVSVVSCSPERLVSGTRRADGRMVLETRPIKGTVPRGATPEADRRAITELLASSKNEAELNMIVDLARNDLGRVCEIGTVQVTEHRAVESYSHVHHTMSTVQGILGAGLDWVDVLRSVFPGGSVTGAPKGRTMEIIDRLEPCARGLYTGSAGWISPEGEFDFNILIRTIALERPGSSGGFNRGARARYSTHTGGAIVIDSDAASEYRETLDKAAALFEGLKG